jgi:hypothetical protein
MKINIKKIVRDIILLLKEQNSIYPNISGRIINKIPDSRF